MFFDGKSKGGAKVADGTFRPTEFKSPFGEVVTNDGKTYLRPNISNDQRGLLGLQNNKLLGYTQSLPNSFSVNDYYDNPFFKSTLRLLKRPIDDQYDIDKRDLSNNLNARNQTGGSYDALQNYFLGRRYDQQYGDATDKARGVSAQAFQQQFQNNLAGLGAIRDDRNSLLAELYQPLDAWATANSGVNQSKGLLSNYVVNQQQLAQQKRRDQLGLASSLFSTLSNLGGGIGGGTFR